MPIRVWLLSLAILICEAQDSPRILVNVRLVNVSFTVHDASGKNVSDLAKDDFDVVDDGSPQSITYFAHSADLPLTLGLVMDVSGSQERFNKRHQRDIEIFLKNVLTARDRAFLLCFGNHLRLASDYSPSPGALIDAMLGFRRKMDTIEEIGPREIREQGTAFYDALYYATSLKLASTEGPRKALIVFSDGEDNSSAHHMLDAIEAAQSENVLLFGIRYTETRHGRLTGRNKYGMRVMARVSRETGGLDFDAEQGDLSQAFRSIGEELRSSYELAYHASATGSPNTFHKIEIRPRKPGLTVRAKTGYFARE